MVASVPDLVHDYCPNNGMFIIHQMPTFYHRYFTKNAPKIYIQKWGKGWSWDTDTLKPNNTDALPWISISSSSRFCTSAINRFLLKRLFTIKCHWTRMAFQINQEEALFKPIIKYVKLRTKKNMWLSTDHTCRYEVICVIFKLMMMEIETRPDAFTPGYTSLKTFPITRNCANTLRRKCLNFKFMTVLSALTTWDRKVRVYRKLLNIMCSFVYAFQTACELNLCGPFFHT